jgi:hypothetical protein
MADFMGLKKKEEDGLEQPKSTGNKPVDLGADVTGPLKAAYEKYQAGRTAIIEPIVGKIAEATDLTPASMPEQRAASIEDTKGKVMPFADLVAPEITDFIPAAKFAKFAGLGSIAAKKIVDGFRGAEDVVKVVDKASDAFKGAEKASEAAKVMKKAPDTVREFRMLPMAEDIVAKAAPVEEKIVQGARTIPQGHGLSPEDKASFLKNNAKVDAENRLKRSKIPKK